MKMNTFGTAVQSQCGGGHQLKLGSNIFKVFGVLQYLLAHGSADGAGNLLWRRRDSA